MESALEKKNKELKKKLAKCKADRKKLEKEITRLGSLLGDRELQIFDMRAKIEGLDKANKGLARHNQRLGETLRKISDARTDFQVQIDGLRRRMDELARSIRLKRARKA